MANQPVAPSEQSIRAKCGAKVWERGRALVKARNLKGLTRAGDELFARCVGSYGEPYQLHARLDNGEVTQLSCSCPFEGGGWCKHSVALLLRYAQSPDDFRETASLAAMIEALSREDLNAFVENIMRREPQLVAGLTQIYNVRSLGDDNGSSSLRSNLRSALAGRGADEARVTLEIAVNEARQLETKKEWAGASEVWRVLLEELVFAVPHFEGIEEEENDDGWGDYVEVEIDVGQSWADTAADGLLRLMETENLAPEIYAAILQTLWGCWRDAYNSSYFVMPEEAIECVIAEADAALWNEVEAFFREKLQLTRPRSAPVYETITDMWGEVDVSDYYFDHGRAEIVGWLSRGLNLRGQSEGALALLQQHGSYRQRLTLLMQARDYAAAEKLALQNQSSRQPNLLAVADDMEGAGQHEIAERLARRARQIARPHDAAVILEWLARFYARRNRVAEAQTQAAALFVARPDAASLLLWKETIASGDEWDDWSNRYPRLEKSPDMTTPLRLKLAILDGRAARALELFRLLSDREKANVAADVARVCEDKFPEKAIEIYKGLGESAIASRSVDNPRAVYKRAAAHWKSARELHKKLDTMNDWITYIRAQREEHKRLRALLDELKLAGL